MADTNSLTMDRPVEHSLLDDGAQHIIGKPLERIDGPKKVSGSATYAAEYPIAGLAYGFLIRSPVGSGTLRDVDGSAAKAMPGVLDVIHDFDRFIRNSQQGGEKEAPTMGVREIAYMGEPVAIVVADSYENARDAAEHVTLAIDEGPGVFRFDDRLDEAEKPEDAMVPAHDSAGDLDAAIAAAPVVIDVIYTTPSQNSAAMEPHASIASWTDVGLTLWGSYQMPSSDRLQLADALNLPPEKVRIMSAYVGGGFGAKLGIAPESVAAAIASKKLGRPVKVAMTRQQVFEATVRRSNTRQHIRLAADKSGKLSGIGHATICSNLPQEDFFEPAGLSTYFLYGGGARTITHDIVRVNWLLSGSMRAPGEAVGMLALENAMDELAVAVGIDPVELRRINEPERDPTKDIPFSSRSLRQCLDDGAERFGWDGRNRTPGGQREGEWLIGHGMAASARSNMLRPSHARVKLSGDGAVVETDMTDIGTGTYTILGQIAGELLGLPIERVDVRLGDTAFPAGAGSGGSFGAGSSGTSVYLACERLRETLAAKLGVAADAMTLKDGQVIGDNRSVAIGDLVGDGIEAVGCIEPGKMDEAFRQASYGAHFCEVAVHAVTGEVRVRRWHSTFAAGRILNERTARSQCLGGITFGIGAALSEDLIHDLRDGKVVNRDLAEYHVPVNADVPAIDVVFLDERDHAANPLHSKGIGELGISGAGAAVTNAIYNATGVRVRDYPATLDKLLAGLPEL